MISISLKTVPEMISDLPEAKVSVKARAGKHLSYTTLEFGFQIKEYGRRDLCGGSLWWKGVDPNVT